LKLKLCKSDQENSQTCDEICDHLQSSKKVLSHFLIREYISSATKREERLHLLFSSFVSFSSLFFQASIFKSIISHSKQEQFNEKERKWKDLHPAFELTSFFNLNHP